MKTEISKHTPGPWRVYPDQRTGEPEASRGWVVEPSGCVTGANNTPPFRAVVTNTPHASEYFGTAETNARLIAAAPELLEAAKELNNQLATLREECRSGRPMSAERRNMVSAALVASDKAIAKAEGK